MKTFLSQNWFKILLILTITIAAFYLGRISNKLGTTVLKSDEQLQIADCAKQAQSVLENEQRKEGEYVSINQRNHYNKSLSKCLVELNTSISDSKGVIFTSEVRDAYEGKVFITCASGSSLSSFCFIPGNYSGTGQAVNMTKEDGDLQIRNYMNN